MGRENWLRVVCKIGSIYLLGILLGSMVLSFTAQSVYAPYFSSAHRTSFVLASLVGAVVGYLILEVIFGRGFKTLKKNWWIGAAGILFTAAITLSCCTGLFGYETSVPDPDSVKSATVTPVYSQSYEKMPVLTTPEELEALTVLHQSMVDFVEEQRLNQPQYINWSEAVSLEITYELNNGSILTRSYQGVAVTDNIRTNLLALFTQPSVERNTNTLLTLDYDKNFPEITAFAPNNPNGVPMSADNSKLLLYAVQQDFFETAGTYGSITQDPEYYLTIEYKNSRGYPQYLQTPIYPQFTKSREILLPLMQQTEQAEPVDPAELIVTLLYTGRSDGKLGLPYIFPKMVYVPNAENDLPVPDLTAEEKLVLMQQAAVPVLTNAKPDSIIPVLLIPTGGESLNGTPLYTIFPLDEDKIRQLTPELSDKLTYLLEEDLAQRIMIDGYAVYVPETAVQTPPNTLPQEVNQ